MSPVGKQRSPARKPVPVPRVSSVKRAIRAIEAFRKGDPVTLAASHDPAVVAFPVETVSDLTLAHVGRSKSVYQLLTEARARTLKIRLYTPEVVAITPDYPLQAAKLRAIADPTDDLSEPLKGPFQTRRAPLPDAFAAAVKLAKLAGLLPSVLVVENEAVKTARCTASPSEIRDYEDTVLQSLAVVTRAHVPLANSERTEIIAFRARDGGPEQYAIVIGDPPRDRAVLTRLHSECFTGDLLDSLRCDCGLQLRGAIAAIAKAGGGILLYLAQEGRGIGLINKLRAYRLQDQGFDTFEANQRLGFEADERVYGIAARMLRLLGYESVRLLTNNPDKVKALEAAGIAVVERVPHAFPGNEHNRNYLQTKVSKAGHLL